MRKLFLVIVGATALSAPTFAADMPSRAPIYKAPMIERMFDWSGSYVGGQVGYIWGRADYTDLVTGTGTDYKFNGWMGGGHIGHNWQSGTLVFGLEADINATGAKGDDGGFGGSIDQTKMPWVGSVRARLGLAQDVNLWYLTGGAAYAKLEHNLLSVGVSESKTQWGWTVGAGIERAFAPNWTARIEYRFTDFGKDTYSFGGLADTRDIDWRTHQVLLGVSYKFGDWGKGPVSARY